MKYFLFFLIVLFSFSSGFGADFILESEILFSNLPQYTGSISFVDLDGDGYDELIFENDDYITSYSLRYATEIESFTKKNDTILRKYAYGYLDDDTLLDFVEVFRWYDGPEAISGYYLEYPVHIKMLQYLSNIGYTSSDTVTLFTSPGSSGKYSNILGIENTFIDDLNNDGEYELYWKQLVDKFWGQEFVLWYYKQYYLDNCYLLEQDTTIQMDWMPSHSNIIYSPYTSGDTLKASFQPVKSGYLYQSHIDELESTWIQLHEYIGDSLISTKDIKNILFCDGEFQESKAKLKSFWLNEINSAYSNFEILSFVEHSVLTHYPMCFDYTWELILSNLSNPDSLETIWSIEYDEDPQIRFMMSDENYPDKFMVVKNDYSYIHSGINGEILDSTISINSTETMLDYRAIGPSGNKYLITYSDYTMRFYSVDQVLDVNNDSGESLIPKSFVLGQPYPNPYNPEVTIPLLLPVKTHLTVEVYNILGQRVITLYNQEAPFGEMELNWNSANLSSGLYFIRAVTNNETATVKAVLLK
ncbi:MAG: T9SS type A sorting domain-containing protein [Candidatus Zixiibacteriota bacterium]